MYDIIVIGAGFGGLSCALSLAEKGAKVLLCETFKYPGGCASTFTRSGYRFESGATLAAGFEEGQLFSAWNQKYSLGIKTTPLNPVVEIRTPSMHLPISSSREALIASFLAQGAPPRVADFFALQERVADALWGLFADPSLLPPFTVSSLLRHLWRSPRYLPLLRLVGTSLESVLTRFGLQQFEPLRVYLNALCQITVQTNLQQAEAPFALAIMDYYYRGAYHIQGGVGQLAWSLLRAFEALGGTVMLANQVRGLEVQKSGVTVRTRQGTFEAKKVIANLLPQNLQQLTQSTNKRLEQLSTQVTKGYGAVMLYLAVSANADIPQEAHHLELIADPSQPFVEGNHIFCSISASEEERGPNQERTVTISTHVPMESTLPDAKKIEQIQATMRQTLVALSPEIVSSKTFEMTASPRTFQRFTGRAQGFVGGVPKRVGLHNYLSMAPKEILPNLYLVGDSIFPGQSMLATAIGGMKVSEVVLRELA
jgi:phytoene dehydrogenase-like protein